MMFYKENDFKEEPLIGEIPREWEVVRFDKVAKIRPGKSKFNVREKNVAFIPMELISEDGIYTNFEIRSLNKVSSYTYCESGDILLAKITPSLENGKQGIVPNEVPHGFALATTEVFPIICESIERIFLFYLLKFGKFRKRLEYSMRATTGRLRVPKDALLSLRIPLPDSLAEQQKIAEILSTVDEAIQKTNELTAKTERLKKGLMQELLTKGIGHKEFKDTEIGRIPREWEVVRFQDLCEKLRSGGTPLTSKKQYYNGKIPFVKIEDITSARKYLSSTVTTITEEGLNDSTAWLVPKNSLLLAIYGSLGSVAINTIELATNQAILGIILNSKKAETEFFYYLFSNLNLKKYTKRTTQANLTAEIIKNLKIPLPPLEEQKAIARILSTVDKKLELEKKEKSRLERIKQSLMDLLLTGKIRVKNSQD